MPTAYSCDIRGRVIARVESGASRREAAEQFEISPSAAIKMGGLLSCDRKVRGQTAWGEHVAIGGARGFFAGVD